METSVLQAARAIRADCRSADSRPFDLLREKFIAITGVEQELDTPVGDTTDRRPAGLMISVFGRDGVPPRARHSPAATGSCEPPVLSRSSLRSRCPFRSCPGSGRGPPHRVHSLDGSRLALRRGSRRVLGFDPQFGLLGRVRVLRIFDHRPTRRSPNRQFFRLCRCELTLGFGRRVCPSLRGRLQRSVPVEENSPAGLFD